MIRRFLLRVRGVLQGRLGISAIRDDLTRISDSLGDAISKLREKVSRPWEEMISLRSFEPLPAEVLAPPGELREATAGGEAGISAAEIDAALARDAYPLPLTADREGYHGENHFDYWLSGLVDLGNLRSCCGKHGVTAKRYLDFGSASGRVVRHAALQWGELEEVVAIDLNRRHVDWIAKHLPASIEAVQGHSIPSLPFEDDRFDLVSAFSVFTHVEAFETTWLRELKRVMKPGGLAWITVHSEGTWREVEEGWPLYGALRNHPDFAPYKESRESLPSERTVFRWHNDRSYSANVFYEMDYIHRVWGRMFEIVEIKRRFPKFQDVVVLRKRG